MKLVVSGDLGFETRQAIGALSNARSLVDLHSRAVRYEGVSDAARDEVAMRCADAQVDHAFLDDEITFASFKLLAIDMDSTLITIECIDELADFAGKKAEVAAITSAAMRGEISDFSESLRRRVSLLNNLSVDALRQVYEQRLRLTGGAGLLIEHARRAGCKTLLLSGGFDYFAERVKARLGIDYAHANHLEEADGRLTGAVSGDIVDGQRKSQIVERTLAALGRSKADVFVIGDGANDMEMMKGAGLSIAFHAKEVVRKAASQAVLFGDLAAVVDWLGPS